MPLNQASKQQRDDTTYFFLDLGAEQLDPRVRHRYERRKQRAQGIEQAAG